MDYNSLQLQFCQAMFNRGVCELATLPFIFFQDVSQSAVAEMAEPEKEVLPTKALIIIITGKCRCKKNNLRILFRKLCLYNVKHR